MHMHVLVDILLDECMRMFEYMSMCASAYVCVVYRSHALTHINKYINTQTRTLKLTNYN